MFNALFMKQTEQVQPRKSSDVDSSETIILITAMKEGLLKNKSYS